MKSKLTRTVVGLIGLTSILPQAWLSASTLPGGSVFIDHILLNDQSVDYDETYRPRVEGDKYVMELTQSGHFGFSGLSADIRSDEDFLVEGRLRVVAGTSSFHGIMWRMDWTRAWIFALNPSFGEYVLIRWESEKQNNRLYEHPVEIVEPAPCEHIKRINPWGDNPWNTLRAVNLGNKLRLYINHKLVKELPWQTTPVTTVGASIFGGEAKVELSRFLVGRTGVYLKEAVACLNVRNVTGPGSGMAVGIGGRGGKEGPRFFSGDTIMIFLRFGGLPLGKHTLHARLFHGAGANMSTWSGWDRVMQIDNNRTDWVHAYPSPGTGSGHWTVHIALDGKVLGQVKYGVDMPGE